MRSLLNIAFLIALFFVFTSNGFGNPGMSQVELEFKSKLQKALSELEQQRSQLSQQQIPLAKHTESLKEELKVVQDELNTLKAVEDSKNLELSTLKNNIKETEKELDYISNTLIDEAVSHLESSFSIGELNSEDNKMLQLIKDRNVLDLDGLKYVENQLKILEHSFDYTQSLFNLQRYNGKALTEEGKLENGQYLQMGPVLYFIADHKKTSGLVIESKSLKPQIFEIDPESTQLLVDFSENKSSLLPLDPSLNRAILIASTEDSLEEHLRKGGVWVYPIVFFAAISILIAVYKFIQLFSLRLPRLKSISAIAELIKTKDFEQAMTLAKKQPKPARKMLTNAVEYGNEPIELIEEAMMESILRTQPKLERFLNILAVTAATAPLLGLLGTVTGIIKTFKLMEVFGAGDPKPLISGISEALITTELGLILAIPALVLHALLSRRVLRVISNLEEYSHHLINMISKSNNPSLANEKN